MSHARARDLQVWELGDKVSFFMVRTYLEIFEDKPVGMSDVVTRARRARSHVQF